MAIVSGPGGLAVSAAEACGRQGIVLADLSAKTRLNLSRIITYSGTSLLNPVDVSLAAHFDLDIFFQATRAVAADPGVDAIIVIGCGMTPETLESIFDPFFTTKPGGTGLGLSIVHSILESYNSWLEVESKINEGTTFTLKFRLIRPPT